MTAPFSFESPADGEATAPATTSPAIGVTDPVQLIQRAVEASGIATYHWTIENDEIVWSANARDILGTNPAGIKTGRAFAAFLDSENFTSRYDTVMHGSVADEGSGVPFQIEYKFRPEGRAGRTSLWIEDQGSWFAGSDGRPKEVYGTMRRIDDRHMRDQHLSFLGNCDSLTGMMNRGRMMESLGGAMTVAGRDNTSCGFVIAAINNLPVVNDAYGFDVADEVIINMGRRLRHVVRTGDAIARYSGSKFGLILNNCTEEDLAIAAERFLSVARESVIETERGPVWALLSIGALIVPQYANDPNTALAHAEEALTEARRLPSDGFVIYKPSQQRQSKRTLNAHSATEIVRCLREDRFRLAFQPVVDATTGEPVFHEALLRMTDQAGEIIAAAHLIPIAEKLGLVRLIDRAVVQMAVAALNKFPDARLSLNISGTTATDPRWYPQITEILASNRSVTGRLIVEITETVALGDLKETIRFVEQLRELGCDVAIDDFGAGYTSFRNLRAMPVDILKLDGTFCSNLSNNQDNQYFVRSLIDLARTFGMKTVAEWVENEEDAALLREWKVDLMQGNLFGEAQLDPPWHESIDAETFQPEDAVAFVLPSEIAWLESEHETAIAPDDSAMPETSPANDETFDEDEVFAFDAPQPAMTEAIDEPGPEIQRSEVEYLEAQEPEVQQLDAVADATDEIAVVIDEPANIEAAAEVMAQVDVEMVDEIEMTASTPHEALPPASDTVEVFEEGLESELAKLRSAIAALDRAFKPREEPEASEPSFADLVSDTAMQEAG